MSDQRRGKRLPGVVLLLALCIPAAGCVSLLPGRPHKATTKETVFSSEQPQKPSAPATAPVIAARSEVQWSIEPGQGQRGKGMEGAGFVGPDGTLEVGPYGSLPIAGLVEKQAEASLEKHVRQYLKDPKVRLRVLAPETLVTPVSLQSTVEWSSEDQGSRPAVTRGQLASPQQFPVTEPPLSPRSAGVPNECHRVTLPPYVIGPPDVLQVESLKGLLNQPVAGPHLVRPDGTISLGSYGSAFVAGLTTDQAREAIARVIHARLDAKVVSVKDVLDGLSVDVLAYNSKFYYVISDGAGCGEQVTRLPITGNETVLDAISLNMVRMGVAGQAPAAPRCQVWVARKSCHGKEQVLPVDWAGITRRGQGDTNYQLLPGDRVYVCGGQIPSQFQPPDYQQNAPRPQQLLDETQQPLFRPLPQTGHVVGFMNVGPYYNLRR